MRDFRTVGRALALCAGFAMAAVAGAQTATPAAAPARPAAAKAAKPAPKAATPAYKMTLEPKAMDLLKAMSARLAAAKSMAFTAVVGYEYPSKLGPPIVYTTRYDVTMQRPDKLRILTPGDGPASEFYYDGKAMAAYDPAANLAAVAAAPPTIDGALKDAYNKAAIYFPFMDMLVTDPYAALTDGAVLAFYVGPSGVVGGVKTDMVVWANKDVFMQIWIGADDKLPRRIRAIFRADPRQLRHEMDLSNWQLDGAVPPETFTSAKLQAAGRMEFAGPKGPPPGVKPIVRTTPSQPKPAAVAPKAN